MKKENIVTRSKFDLVLLATFLTIFICNISNAAMLKQCMTVVSAELITVVSIVTCLCIALCNYVVQKYEKLYCTLFKYMPILLVFEPSIYLMLMIYGFIADTSDAAWVFYIMNNLAFCSVTTLIICCSRRLNRFRYTRKQREKKDSMQTVLYNLGVVFGSSLALLLHVSNWNFKWILLIEFVGVSVDNALYIIVHREVVRDHPESMNPSNSDKDDA